MKVYKVELMVIDFENMGAEGIEEELKNTRYANHCMSPTVMSIEGRDIGEWTDDHPLNMYSTQKATYKALFSPKAWDDDLILGPLIREAYSNDSVTKTI